MSRTCCVTHGASSKWTHPAEDPRLRLLTTITYNVGEDMRVLVTGGAGFLWSHLCDALLGKGAVILCIDNMSTGRIAHISHLIGPPRFEYPPLDPTPAFH